MEISRESVRHIAALSRLSLTEEELTRAQHELADILTYMKTIDEISPAELSCDDTKPTLVPLSNVMREDEPRPSAIRDRLLENAPCHTNETIVVPKTVE